MKIAYNARLLAWPNFRGFHRYTVSLLNEFSAMGMELFLYTDRPPIPEQMALFPKRGTTVRIAPPMRYLAWEQKWVPRQCEIDGVDLLHSPVNFGLPWSAPCPMILTLHDAIDQLLYAKEKSAVSKMRPDYLKTVVHQWAARTRADYIVTVSQHAKRDLTRHLNIPDQKITVIYEAADRRFHAPVTEQARRAVRQQNGLLRPYVLYLGGWEPRKNVPFLFEAFAAARLDGVDLVVAGGGETSRTQMELLACSLGIQDSLRLTGRIEEEHLPALYAEALCFVHPSRYEGFGLQLCEAMATGCPVLAARSTCLPEIVGGGGDTFRLELLDDLVHSLQRVVDDPGYRSDLSRRAKTRSADFSWRKAAEETVALYQKAVGKRTLQVA